MELTKKGSDGADETSGENERTVRRVVDELINEGEFDAAPELLAADYVRRELGSEELVVGAEGFADFLAGVRRSFPDLTLRIDDLYAAGDVVVAKMTCTGTHEGEFRGAAPTGRRFEMEGFVVHELADGKVARATVCWDRLGMMQQLGFEFVDETTPER